VCALGDTTYTHFCRCGKQLDAALAAAGASALVPRVDVDKEDWPKVDAWISAVLAGLTELAAAGTLKSFAQLGGVPNAAASAEAAATAAAGSKFSKSRPYYARVVAVEGLCVLSGLDDKDTVRLELELGPDAAAAGGLAYLPGDALGIWPTNPPQVRAGRVQGGAGLSVGWGSRQKEPAAGDACRVLGLAQAASPTHVDCNSVMWKQCNSS
jgi:sulfite reductase (NADPH) flavoprotein alpha-component